MASFNQHAPHQLVFPWPLTRHSERDNHAMIRPLDARPIVETFHKSLFSQKLPGECVATDAIEINIHILCLQGERWDPKKPIKKGQN